MCLLCGFLLAIAPFPVRPGLSSSASFVCGKLSLRICPRLRASRVVNVARRAVACAWRGNRVACYILQAKSVGRRFFGRRQIRKTRNLWHETLKTFPLFLFSAGLTRLYNGRVFDIA